MATQIELAKNVKDVGITNPVDNNLFVYNSATELWENQTPTEAGLDDVYVEVAGDTMTGDLAITGSIITTVPLGYAEMYMYGNTTPCLIDTANIYHAIYHTFGNNDGTLAPLIDATYFTYKAGIEYAITVYTDYNGTVAGTTQVTTSATHALLAGEPITITGTTNYNGTYLVTGVIDATNFYVTIAFAGDDGTGSVRRPATLKCLIAGSYKAGFYFSGTAANPNDNIKIELNKDLIPIDNISSRGIWSSSSKFETIGSQGLLSLTAGQYLWAAVKNYSGTGDFTFYSGSVNIHRLI